VVLDIVTAHGEDTEDKAFYVQVLIPPVAPTVDFSADLTTGEAPPRFNSPTSPATVARPSPPGPGFRDSGTSTEQSPLHTFAAEGTYTVSLTATNSAGPEALRRPATSSSRPH